MFSFFLHLLLPEKTLPVCFCFFRMFEDYSKAFFRDFPSSLPTPSASKTLSKQKRRRNVLVTSFRIHRSRRGEDLDVGVFRARLIQHAVACFTSCIVDLRPAYSACSFLRLIEKTLYPVKISFYFRFLHSLTFPWSHSRCKYFKFSTDQQKCQIIYCWGKKFITNFNRNLILTTFKCEKRGSNTECNLWSFRFVGGC
jgi:hypothetical protein